MSLMNMGSVRNRCRGQLPEGLPGPENGGPCSAGQRKPEETWSYGCQLGCSSGAIENLSEVGTEVGRPVGGLL